MTVHNKEYSLFQNSLGKTLYIKKDDCNLQESRIRNSGEGENLISRTAISFKHPIGKKKPTKHT